MAWNKLILLTILTASFFILPNSVSAATLSLTPQNGNLEINDIKAVQVKLNTDGKLVNGVSAFLAYPHDKLEVAWITYGSAFNIAAEGTYGGGTIKISRGNITGVSGNVTVATIGFKGKTLGLADVRFIPGSAVPLVENSADSLDLNSSSGAEFNVVEPSGSPVVSQTTTTDDLTPPVISNLQVLDISTDSATIKWKTDEPATSYVEFGFKDNYFLSSADTTLVTEHQIELENPVFVPGTTYHFIVKSVDKSNNLSSSNEMQFKLVGYQVILKIIGDELPTDTQVFIQNQEIPSISSKEIRFESLPPGNHLVTIKSNSFEKTHAIEVQNTVSPQIFEIPFQIETAEFIVNRNKVYVTTMALLIAFLSVLAPVILVLMKRKRHKFLHHPHHNPERA